MPKCISCFDVQQLFWLFFIQNWFKSPEWEYNMFVRPSVRSSAGLFTIFVLVLISSLGVQRRDAFILYKCIDFYSAPGVWNKTHKHHSIHSIAQKRFPPKPRLFLELFLSGISSAHVHDYCPTKDKIKPQRENPSPFICPNSKRIFQRQA